MPWRVASDWSRFFERGSTSGYFNLNTGANNGTGGLANGLNGGSFSLVQSGNDLNLVFTAAGGAAFMRWRKRRQGGDDLEG